MAEDKNNRTTSSDRMQEDDVARTVDRLQDELDELKAKLVPSSQAAPRCSQTVTLKTLRAIISARRKREGTFGTGLFADPAWDMLLELYAADLAQKRLAVSNLCRVAAVPATTALRWIEKLEHLGWLLRRPDPLDRRRVFIELAEAGTVAMERYFADLRAGELPV